MLPHLRAPHVTLAPPSHDLRSRCSPAAGLAGVGIFFQQDSETNEVFVKTIVKGGSAVRACNSACACLRPGSMGAEAVCPAGSKRSLASRRCRRTRRSRERRGPAALHSPVADPWGAGDVCDAWIPAA